MNPTFVIEPTALVVESEANAQPETCPVGNAVYTVEVSNIVIGSLSELIDDFKDSQIVSTRLGEETETMEQVFSELHIA